MPLLLLLLGVACGHDAALTPGVYPPGRPFNSGPLVRLTFNPGADLDPVWLPDGSGVLYTRERTDRSDLDRCLSLLPPGGGTIARDICDRVPAADDSVDAFTAAAVSPAGRIAYIRATAPLTLGWPKAPLAAQLVVASWEEPSAAQALRSVPFPGPSGTALQGVSQVRWLGDTSLVFIGAVVDYVAVCPGCTLIDTLATGHEIVRLDFGGPAVVLSMLPGSDQASSAATAGADTVYFTRNGDSRVLRLQLSTGTVAVVHDFGSGAIARDAQVAAGRLLAVVGGKVSFAFDTSLGATVQRDSGGPLVLVEPSSGVETQLTDPNDRYRHPALAPDGRHVVAERLSGRTTDLYLLEIP
jgi:WD40 repeat protein